MATPPGQRVLEERLRRVEEDAKKTSDRVHTLRSEFTSVALLAQTVADVVKRLERVEAGGIENLSYRVGNLESSHRQLIRWMVGLIITILGALVVYLISKI